MLVGSDKEESVSVSIRVRPMNQRELKAGQARPCWKVDSQANTMCQLDADGKKIKSSNFTFDRVFGETSSTDDVYSSVAQTVIRSALEGVNGTIFAYGQTSSGKTYSMSGIIQRAIADIFEQARSDTQRTYTVAMSCLEIYNEVIKDLMDPTTGPLKVHEDLRRGIYVGNLTEDIVNEDEILQKLSDAEKNRTTGATAMNAASSRSHSILRLVVCSELKAGMDSDPDDSGATSGAKLKACLNLVDLAGSERCSHTKSQGLRLKEGGHINKSLLTLGTVIRKLSENSGCHVPYRDSKLTRILQTALGGNSRTAILCCVTQAPVHADETLSTLKFASRAKHITNKIQVNEIVDDATTIRRLRHENACLKRKLQYAGWIDTSSRSRRKKHRQRRSALGELPINRVTSAPTMDISKPSAASPIAPAQDQLQAMSVEQIEAVWDAFPDQVIDGIGAPWDAERRVLVEYVKKLRSVASSPTPSPKASAATLRSELEALTAAAADKDAKLADAESRAALAAEIQEQVAVLEDQEQILERRTKELAAQLAAARENAAVHIEAWTATSSRIDELKSENQTLHSEAQVWEKQARKTVAALAAAGGRVRVLQGSLSSESQRAVALESRCQEFELERKGHQQQVTQLEAAAQAVESAAKQRIEESESRIAELKRTVSDMQEASADAQMDQDFISLGMKQQIEDMEAELEATKAEAAALAENAQKTTRDLELAVESRREADALIADKDAKIAALEASCDAAKSKEAELEAKLQQLQAAADEYKTSAQTLREQVEGLQTEQEEAAAGLAENAEAHRAMSEELDRARSNASKLQSEIDTLRAEAEKLRSALKNVEDRQQGADAALAAANLATADGEQRLQKFKTKMKMLQERLKGSSKGRAAERKAREALENKLQMMQYDMQRLRDEIAGKKEEIRELERRVPTEKTKMQFVKKYREQRDHVIVKILSSVLRKSRHDCRVLLANYEHSQRSAGASSASAALF